MKKYEENMLVVLGCERNYVGRESFESFLKENILISKEPEDFVFQMELAQLYAKYAVEAGLPLANSMDCGKHLSTSGIGIKRMSARFNFEYAYQGMRWIDTSGKTFYERSAKRKKPLLDEISRKKQKLVDNKKKKEQEKTKREDKRMEKEGEEDSSSDKELPPSTTEPEVQTDEESNKVTSQETTTDNDSLISNYINNFIVSTGAAAESEEQREQETFIQGLLFPDKPPKEQQEQETFIEELLFPDKPPKEQQELETFIDELLFPDKPPKRVQETTAPANFGTKPESVQEKQDYDFDLDTLFH